MKTYHKPLFGSVFFQGLFFFPLQTLRYVQSLPFQPKVPFTQKFPNVDAVGTDCPLVYFSFLKSCLVRFLALDLLEKMLCFDPKTRINAEEALAHPFLDSFHDPEDEPDAPNQFDWSFSEREYTTEQWVGMVQQEITTFDGNAAANGASGEDNMQ